MVRYAIRRILITIPIIIGIAIIVFTLLYFTPGDPAEMILGTSATQEELESYRAYLGIDRPYLVQLGDYLYKMFIKFDLGTSWVYGDNIYGEILTRLPRTFAISMFSMVVGLLTGIPMGVYAAVKQNSRFDHFVLLITSVMHSIPNYVYAMVLIIIFSLQLQWFPSYGIGSWRNYVLPCACLFIGAFGGNARSMRTEMLEVIRSDYVIAARAQGINKNRVYFQHALPNALIPLITQLGTQFAGALGGTIILETIFSIPGTGLYIQNAINMRDIPIIMGTTIFLAIYFCLVMLVVDLVYAAVDPRIKAQFVDSTKSRKRRG